MKKRDRVGQLKRSLDKLFFNPDFIAEIVRIRSAAEIPEGGFTSMPKYRAYLEQDIKPDGKMHHFHVINPGAHKLASLFEYPDNYSLYIEAFIALGYRYESFKPEVPYSLVRDWDTKSATSCAFNAQSDLDSFVSIHIYPNAGQNEVVDFVRDNWNLIKRELKKKGGAKSPKVRNVDTNKRKLIYTLYRKHEIDSAGIWTPGKSEAPIERPSCLKGLSPERVRAIIYEETKKERIKRGYGKTDK